MPPPGRVRTEFGVLGPFVRVRGLSGRAPDTAGYRWKSGNRALILPIRLYFLYAEPCDVGAYELGELAFQIATTTLSDGDLAQPYSLTLEAVGGQPPYLWSDLGTLPAGLSVDATNGIITGNPSEIGMFEVTIAVSDDVSDNVEKDFALRVLGPDQIFFDRFE